MQVSIIIPTLERTKELKRLLVSFGLQSLLPKEIIIVHQGDNDLSNFLESFKDLPIIYLKATEKSLTKARNIGVSKAKGKIVGFLDDDIVLDKNYIKNIVNFFDNHKNALGVQGIITNFEEGHAQKVGGNHLVYGFYNFFAKIFLLNNASNKNKLLLSGRNQYASRVEDVQVCEWLSGIGNYKKQVFNEFKFDESLGGYALGEDKLFSYPIQEKYPKSLFVDPSICCEHHHADDGRPVGQKWVEMRIYNTWYLWNKLLKKKGFLAREAFWWANTGDIIIGFLAVIMRTRRFSFVWWHIVGYSKLLWKR